MKAVAWLGHPIRLPILLTAALLAAFGAGFMRYPNLPNPAASGTMFALLSATAWAWSVFTGRYWGAVFNYFAALFAAASAGYLAPNP